MHSAFFEPAGTETFAATAATAGPWSEHAQHGGPPSALAARALERHAPDDNHRLTRVTVDILRPVPLGRVTVRTRMVRPGKRVSLLEAVMEAGGQEVLHARGWRIARPEGAPPAAATARQAQLPEIPAEQEPPSFPGGYSGGYLAAIDWRFLAGHGFDSPGPARAWTRPKIPLIPGEQPSGMCRALLIADSGSGISAVLDAQRFLFINVDLTVVLAREPAGEWLLLDSETTIGESGAGLTRSALSDRTGLLGSALQTLLVTAR